MRLVSNKLVGVGTSTMFIVMQMKACFDCDQGLYTTTLPKKGLSFKRRREDVPDLTYLTMPKKGKKIIVKKR